MENTCVECKYHSFLDMDGQVVTENGLSSCSKGVSSTAKDFCCNKFVMISEFSDLDEIDEHCILIGSRAWGWYTDESDYDYCITEENFNKLNLDGNKLQKTRSDSSTDDSGDKIFGNSESYYYRIDNKTLINFIVFSNIDNYNATRRVDQMLHEIVDFRNKDNRKYKKHYHNIVETLLDIELSKI